MVSARREAWFLVEISMPKMPCSSIMLLINRPLARVDDRSLERDSETLPSPNVDLSLRNQHARNSPGTHTGAYYITCMYMLCYVMKGDLDACINYNLLDK